MQRMNTLHESDEEEEMNETNIRQFMEAARQYLLGLVPAQSQVAATPLRSVR